MDAKEFAPRTRFGRDHGSVPSCAVCEVMEHNEERELDRDMDDPARSWPEVIQSGDDLLYKERINLLLFQILPPMATLRETEAIAVAVYHMVQKCYERTK